MTSRQSLLGAAGSLALSFFLLLPYLSERWHLADDAYYGVVPAMLLQARTLAEGMWPHWNLNVGLGQPWSTYIGGGLFYPPQPLWTLLVGLSEVKYVWYVLMHLAAGGWLAADFARRIGLSNRAGLFFALTFIGNGVMIGFFQNPCLLIPMVFWPLLGSGLLAIHDTEKGSRRAGIRMITIALFAIEVGGYPLSKAIIFSSTALVYLAMARAPGTWAGGIPWRSLGVACLAAILMSSPEWMTTIAVLPLLDRVARDIYDHSLYHNVSNFLQLGTLVFPAQFIERNKPQLAIMHLERSWWIGALTLPLILAAGRNMKLGLTRYRAVIAVCVAAFLFALGGHSFLRDSVNYLVPLFASMRHAHLGRLPVYAFLPFLAAVAFQELERADPRTARAKSAAQSVTLLWVAFLAACAVAALSEADRFVLPHELYLDPSTGWKSGALHFSFYLLLAYSAWAVGTSAKSGLVLGVPWAWLVLGIQFASLADLGYAHRFLISMRGDQRIKEVDLDFRVSRPQENSRSVVPPFTGSDWFSWEGNVKVLNAYVNPEHRWFAPAKSDPMIAPLLSTLVSCQENARVVLGAPTESQPLHSCQGAAIRIDSYFGNVIQVSGLTQASAIVVAHDLYDTRWTATVDGAPAQLRRAFNYFKAVEVPPGRWTVRFEYRDPLFPALWFSAAAGALLMVFPPLAFTTTRSRWLKPS